MARAGTGGAGMGVSYYDAILPVRELHGDHAVAITRASSQVFAFPPVCCVGPGAGWPDSCGVRL